MKALWRPARPYVVCPCYHFDLISCSSLSLSLLQWRRPTYCSLHVLSTVQRPCPRAFSCAISSAGRFFHQRATWLTPFFFLQVLCSENPFSVGPHLTNLCQRAHIPTVALSVPLACLIFQYSTYHYLTFYIFTYLFLHYVPSFCRT